MLNCRGRGGEVGEFGRREDRRGGGEWEWGMVQGAMKIRKQENKTMKQVALLIFGGILRGTYL